MRKNTDKWVLQLAHTYAPPFLDCARQYAVLFKNTDYKVCTVFLKGAYSPEAVEGAASDRVIFLEQSSKEISGLKLRAIHAVKKLHKETPFEFCIAHRSKPIYIALISTTIPVFGVHHAFGDYRRKSKRLFVNLFKKRLSLLAVSDAVRDEIRQKLPTFDKKNIQTLYNRINIDDVRSKQLSREEARSALKLPPQGWIIGNVGRLHPDKDQATLIKAFSKAMPKLSYNTYLAIMGSGRLESRLRTLAKDLKIEDKVIFLGQIKNGRSYFKAFDLFVLSSNHEPFGMVLLEAMSAGLPVISSDCGGAKEVVKDSSNLFPLGDDEALAHILTAKNYCNNSSRVNLFTDKSLLTTALSRIKIPYMQSS